MDNFIKKKQIISCKLHDIRDNMSTLLSILFIYSTNIY